MRADDEARRIRAVLERQSQAWNRGDLDGFMDGYERSDRLSFSAGGRTMRGWTAVRERYRSRYDSRAKMGTLRFSELEIDVLNSKTALVLGRWEVRRADGTLAGNFSLVMQRDGDWRIIHDHTSSDPPPATQAAE